MFKENRLIYREAPSVSVVVAVVEGQKFDDLYARFRQLYGEEAGLEKGRAMLKRVEEHCYKVEKAFKGESPDKLANMIRKGAMQEFELERQIIMSELKQRAKDVAKAAAKASKVPVAPKLPVAPSTVTVRNIGGRFYAKLKEGQPMQEVQDPWEIAPKPKPAAAKAAKAAAKKGWAVLHDPAELEKAAKPKPKPRSKPGSTPSKWRKIKLKDGKLVQVGGVKIAPSGAAERMAAAKPKPVPKSKPSSKLSVKSRESIRASREAYRASIESDRALAAARKADEAARKLPTAANKAKAARLANKSMRASRAEYVASQRSEKALEVARKADGVKPKPAAKPSPSNLRNPDGSYKGAKTRAASPKGKWVKMGNKPNAPRVFVPDKAPAAKPKPAAPKPAMAKAAAEAEEAAYLARMKRIKIALEKSKEAAPKPAAAGAKKKPYRRMKLDKAGKVKPAVAKPKPAAPKPPVAKPAPKPAAPKPVMAKAPKPAHVRFAPLKPPAARVAAEKAAKEWETKNAAKIKKKKAAAKPKPKPRSKPGSTPSKWRKMKLKGGKPVQVGGVKIAPSGAAERMAAARPKSAPITRSVPTVAQVAKLDAAASKAFIKMYPLGMAANKAKVAANKAKAAAKAAPTAANKAKALRLATVAEKASNVFRAADAAAEQALRVTTNAEVARTATALRTATAEAEATAEAAKNLLKKAENAEKVWRANPNKPLIGKIARDANAASRKALIIEYRAQMAMQRAADAVKEAGGVEPKPKPATKPVSPNLRNPDGSYKVAKTRAAPKAPKPYERFAKLKPSAARVAAEKAARGPISWTPKTALRALKEGAEFTPTRKELMSTGWKWTKTTALQSLKKGWKLTPTEAELKAIGWKIRYGIRDGGKIGKFLINHTGKVAFAGTILKIGSIAWLSYDVYKLWESNINAFKGLMKDHQGYVNQSLGRDPNHPITLAEFARYAQTDVKALGQLEVKLAKGEAVQSLKEKPGESPALNVVRNALIFCKQTADHIGAHDSSINTEYDATEVIGAEMQNAARSKQFVGAVRFRLNILKEHVKNLKKSKGNINSQTFRNTVDALSRTMDLCNMAIGLKKSPAGQASGVIDYINLGLMDVTKAKRSAKEEAGMVDIGAAAKIEASPEASKRAKKARRGRTQDSKKNLEGPTEWKY